MLRSGSWKGAAALLAGVALAALAPAAPALAQAESREGLYLQNQILQLRQEMEILRRSGGGGGYAAPQLPPPGRGGAAGGGEIVGQLLERVGNLEEEVRRQRGRAEQAEYANRTLQQQVEKLQGDVEYRFNQMESRGAAAPAAGGSPPAGRAAGGQQQGALTPSAPTPSPPPGQPAAPAPRTPELALREGQAALGRRDYPAAEAAAREVLAVRGTPRAQDAGILLGDSLIARRSYQDAALAYHDAYTAGRTSSRAPEALIGRANGFNGLNLKRDACTTLDELRSGFPRLSGNLSERADQARQRAGCR